MKTLMIDYQILPISEGHIEGFCSAVDSVAKEHEYLAFLEGPPLEMSRAFVLENLHGDWPHFIAIHDNRVIGWCDITSLHRDVYAHVGSLGIGVLASYRGHGIGKALIQSALEKAKSRGLTRVELTVREKNYSAIRLYEKFGFVKEGLHRNAIRVCNKYENQISMALLYE